MRIVIIGGSDAGARIDAEAGGGERMDVRPHHGQRRVLQAFLNPEGQIADWPRPGGSDAERRDADRSAGQNEIGFR